MEIILSRSQIVKSDEYQGTQDILLVYHAALLCQQFCQFANGGVKISIDGY